MTNNYTGQRVEQISTGKRGVVQARSSNGTIVLVYFDCDTAPTKLLATDLRDARV